MRSIDAAQTLRAIEEACPLGIIALDLNGNVCIWSPGAEAILGWNEDEMLGKRLECDLDPSSRKELELRWRTKDGSSAELAVRTAPWRDSSENVRGFIAVLTDISSRRRMEQERLDLLQRTKAEGRFRELLEAAPDAIIEVDREGRIVLLNAVTEKLFGYRRDELMGQTMD